MKNKVIALIGKSGSGKDTILQKLDEADNVHSIISCTTRPMRQGEIPDYSYHFLTPELFNEYDRSGQLLESTYFKGWHYGTPKYEIKKDKINVGVFNPAGIHSLLKQPDIDLTVYWITASDKTRLLRQLNREDCPDVAEIIRRYGTDENDFSEINFEYTELKNETPDDIYNAVDYIMEKVQTHSALDISN